MNLYEAIFERRSIRKFRMEAVDDVIISGMFAFFEEIEPLFPKIKTKISVINGTEWKPKFAGLANVSAPHYIVIYAEDIERSAMNAGYIMQKIALFLTAKGVGTCYQGTVKKKDKKMDTEGLSCVMVVAFGYPKSQPMNPGYAAKRLSLEELCAFKEHPKAHVSELLETARLAPSSFNSQPWRFVVYDNRFHVFSKKPVGGHHLLNKHNEFNFGVMLANVMLAAEEIWIDVDLIKLNNITHKTLPNNQYVISVLLKP